MQPGGATPDPAGGVYKMKFESVNETVWATRTADAGRSHKAEIDDIMFDLGDSYPVPDSCLVTGYSRSRAISYYDYSTNYCNIYNVLKTSGL